MKEATGLKMNYFTTLPFDRAWVIWFFAAVVLAGLPQTSQALDFSGVPGTVIDYDSLNYDLFYTTPRDIVSDPCIVVLANGNYIAGHSMTGRESTANTSAQTSLFLSTNQGQTWSSLGILGELFTASIVEHNGSVWLFGTTKNGGGASIYRSQNGGVNWTRSATFSYAGHYTPDCPVVYNNRLWTAANLGTFQAPESANFLLQSSWTKSAGMPASTADWLTGTAGIEEGQIVGVPGMGLFLMPRVNDHPYSPFSRVDPVSGVVSFDPDHNYARLPGGEKKFGSKYDAGSGKIFVVSNPVLPAYPGSELPNMVRNTGAILSSRDMLNWKVEKLYVFSGNWDTEGFGYANLDFDGDDMVLATRTAFPVPGQTTPTRGHDSNILGFFKVPDFRNLVPDHYLKIEGNFVKRYERTQYQDAPLGVFELGVALNSPSRLGQDANGDVYIQDSTGIRHFDASGNFLRTTNAAPVALQTAPLTVVPPNDGSCSWIKTGSGDWSDPLNWYYWNRPDTSEDIAVFGSAATAPTTIDIPSDSREWLFNTDGNLEGWTTKNTTNIIVSGGTFQTTPTTTDPSMTRANQSFYGDDVPTVTIRMRADVSSTTLQFYWGTAVSNTIAAARLVTAVYTGNGEFQDVVFSPAGHAQWDGQIIKQMRIDPVNGSLAALEIDSITVKKEATQMKGLRFVSAQPYTLAGGGALAIGADTGPATIHAGSGSHAIQLPVTLNSDADAQIDAGAVVDFSGGFSLNGKTLDVDGSGTLRLKDGRFSMENGTLKVRSSVTFSNSTNFFDGTVEFPAPAGFSPAAGDAFHILEGTADVGTFETIVLPALVDGLGWDSFALYSNGNISVILKVPASWMATYNLPQDGSADFIDSDEDGFDNYSEWKAGTNPTNELSFFNFDLSGSMSVPTGIQLRWNSLTGRTYRVESGTNLMDNPAFTVLQTGIPGADGVTDFIDTSATNKDQGYYRVYVE